VTRLVLAIPALAAAVALAWFAVTGVVYGITQAPGLAAIGVVAVAAARRGVGQPILISAEGTPVIGTGILIKSGVILGIIGYVGGRVMANGAADVAANVIGTGTAATIHGLKQTGKSSRQPRSPSRRPTRRGTRAMSSRRRKKTLLAAVLAGGGTAYVASHYRRKTAKTRSWFRAAAEWRTQAFVFVGFCYLWGKTGSLIAAALLTALLAGGGVSAWYWWRHKKTGITYRDAAKQMRQRKSLEQKWNHAILEGTSFVKAGGTVPPLKNVTFDAGDVTARVYTGSYAIATDKFAPHLPLIAEVVGCRDIRYTSPAPGVMDLRFCFSDPLEKVVKPSDLKPIKPGVAPFGLTDRGDVIGLPVLNKDGEAIFTPLLIGGVSGSGKSSDVWSLLAGLIVAQIPVRLPRHRPGRRRRARGPR
jgi:hypothetical protein